jgi:outer membrane protein assembly factor BamB
MLLSGDTLAQLNWPHLRGPRYDAISTETGLTDSWPQAGPPVLWCIDLGQGYSGFIVGSGKLFTQFQSRTSEYVVALDPNSGKELWRTRVGPAWQPLGEYPGSYATPTWYEERIYYTTPLGRVGCLDAVKGEEIWSLDLRDRFGLSGVDFGYAATPLVEDGRVILPVGGENASIVALRATDGGTAWAAGNEPASYCPIYPITYEGRRLVVGYLQNALVLHDAATGERVFRERISNHYDEHSAWPLFADPYLFISAPFKRGAELRQLGFKDKAISARPVWVSKALSNDVCSSLLFEGHVYGFDLQQAQSSPHRASRGIFKCLELASGATRWETDQIGQATAICADGKLILLNDTGTLILARATHTGYQELGRSKVLEDAPCWTPPTLWNRRLFVRNQSKAACLFLAPESTLDADQVVTRSAPMTERFNWSSLLPREPEYPHDAPTQAELARWFAWSLVGVFAAAGLLALVAALVKRIAARSWLPGRTMLVFFVATSFVLGLVGSTIYSEWAETFILTWPVCLYLSFRLILALEVWAEHQPRGLGIRLRCWGGVVVFLGICFGYYKLCAAIGYAVGWCFLVGFLPASAPAALAARQRRWWLRWLLDALGFSIYFWLSGMSPEWKSRVGSW